MKHNFALEVRVSIDLNLYPMITNFMSNVKGFYGTNRQMGKQTGQKLYAPDLSVQGYKNLN